MWDYSPAEIAGFLRLATERRTLEVAEQLAIGTMAARGDPKEIKKMLKEMSKG
ncbi:hypothetical protein [Mesorhizobium sp.]|uniref:hypothetical protein n=1 Tax=Mesorhizobium sp. TaxID=1871066 RepID=UPI0025E543E2|nr:hypothetical protein [Mesorhizobium sp.]